MFRKFFTAIIIFSVQSLVSNAQSQPEIKWWDPASNEFSCIEGQGWPQELKGTYSRLPARAEKSVRKEVWDLSRNATGLVIRFTTNSPEIIVKYKVTDEIASLHMPATGVSGVDLYATGKDGGWLWCYGKYQFKDTIVYRFKNYQSTDSLTPFHQKGGEYRLYLPLYNTVSWMNIGTREGSSFTPTPLQKEKPVLIYGTSIAQGGCASRTGMAWTSILGRSLDRPVINLGFSGNGLLEKEVIDLCTEVDAKVFVLDCLPNLIGRNYSAPELEKVVKEAVAGLRTRHPATPILLVDHAGYGNADVDPEARNTVANINKFQYEAFRQLQSNGDSNIFYLSKTEIGMKEDGMVDGNHPTDRGMVQYASAVENKLRAILHEPIGKLSTTIPCSQNRDADTYDWRTRHNEVITLNKSEPAKIIFVGNSITHYWGGRPTAPISRGPESWKTYIEPHDVRNLGFGWDRVENVLWRVYHDELDGYSAKQIVMLIGTNNLDYNTDPEILAGLRALVSAIRTRQPKSAILMVGILPRQHHEKRIAAINKSISILAKSLHVAFTNPGTSLLTAGGSFDSSSFTEDGVHPNEAGYQKIGKRIEPLLIK